MTHIFFIYYMETLNGHLTLNLTSTLTVLDLVRHVLTERDLINYDYYIYNNSHFVAVEVELDDPVSSSECLLHICRKGVTPREDRFERPQAVYHISDLYY
jgi:hypothetical protein